MSADGPLSWQQLFTDLAGGLGAPKAGPAGRIYREWEGWFARQAERARGGDATGRLAAAMEAARLARQVLDGAVQAALDRAGHSGADGAGEPGEDPRIAALISRVEALEAEVAALRAGPPPNPG